MNFWNRIFVRQENAKDAVALIAGSVYPLAFAPFDFSAAMFISLGALFFIWMESAPNRAAFRGLLFGLGMFGFSSVWAFNSLYSHAGISLVLSVGIFSFLVLILAACVAVVGWLQARFHTNNDCFQLLLLIPSFWLLAEFARTYLFTGFPLLLAGYSQVDTALVNYAPYLGVHGVSLLVTVCSGLLALMVRHTKSRKPAFAGMVSIFLVGVVAGLPSWTEPTDKKFSAALIPGVLPSIYKWNYKYREEILNHFWQTSRQYKEVDLIIWPELSLPVAYNRLSDDYRKNLLSFIEATNTNLVFGAAESVSDQTRGKYYNSAITLGSGKSVYHKQHMIPFLEYYPFSGGHRFFSKYFNIPMSSFIHGNRNQPLADIKGVLTSINICYEDAFPFQFHRNTRNAEMVINLSEDGWFENTTKVPQRIQISRMRAIESGRPVLRVANNGESALINYDGTVVASNRENYKKPLEVTVVPRIGETPYMRFGLLPVIVILIASLLVCALPWANRLRNRD